MAMKRAMKAAAAPAPAMRAMKAKKAGTEAIKAMKATKTLKAKTATKPKAMNATKAVEDSNTFIKKWDAIYYEYVNGEPFTWRLEDIIHNKRTGKVAEHWRWGPA